MLRKITDVWPQLIRSIRYPGGEGQSLTPSASSGDDEDPDSDEIDEKQLLSDYKNLFWTRVITIESFEQGEQQRWPIGPDIVEECEEVQALQPADDQAWAPLFEPERYNKDHGPLQVENFKLS